ncbi:unnamed protein product [Parascedosporium putredinis]|uniref:NADH-ubiquinone oxidoreductase n=1 Tax=Parascedosporium putredinis TaxID=1442378 RepID=A0A9P1M7L7_9PEZI|nr:unnamed protein product [Parascedosporium putredinis]CAI7988301.1 unnamed protein product [Parascedosporium putredinis]
MKQSFRHHTHTTHLSIPTNRRQIPQQLALGPSWRPDRLSSTSRCSSTPLLSPTRSPVKEIGATSAPLLSAAFFIGARCRDYNDDYMQCKTEANGRGELECMKEGRRVTRCAASVLKDINTHCLNEFRRHWMCLEEGNQQLWQCRPEEWKLNKCVFENLKLEKVVPDQPKNSTPVHLRTRQVLADFPILKGQGQPFVAPQADSKDA